MIAISVNNRSLFIILVLGYIIHMSFGIAKAYKKDGKTNIELRNELKKVILLIYVWILISTTLLPILIPPVGAPCIDFNFNVGEMFRFEDNDILIRNVFGNIMLLMPLGFCIVVCLDKRLSSKKIFF